jgi:hypothetical protein
MHNVILPPARPATKDLSYYRLVPDTLILEMPDAIKQFQEDTSEMQVAEYNLAEVISEIMLFIGDGEFANMGIEQLEGHFRQMYVNGDNYADGRIMGRAVAVLAQSLVNIFKSIKAYMPDGNLPFDFHKWVVRDEVIVFTKLLDYKPTINKEDNEYDPNRWYEYRTPDSDQGHVGE